jgi:WXG100 family type VII secretion target
MSGFRVTPSQLQSMSGTVSRVSNDVRGQHVALKSQLSPLFGSEWSGAAAAQFADLYQQFDQSAKNLSDALDGIGRLLNSAGVAYADVEASIAATFR